jgi:hypothetical protein
LVSTFRKLQYVGYGTVTLVGHAVYWHTKMCVLRESILPMNQTGERTLNNDDIALLNAGFAAFLPVDTNGHAVLCLDSSRRMNHSDATVPRVSFDAGSVA